MPRSPPAPACCTSPECGPNTTPTTTAASCAIPTATTSKPYVTPPNDWRLLARSANVHPGGNASKAKTERQTAAGVGNRPEHERHVQRAVLNQHPGEGRSGCVRQTPYREPDAGRRCSLLSHDGGHERRLLHRPGQVREHIPHHRGSGSDLEYRRDHGDCQQASP